MDGKETIISESSSDTARRIRVYKPNGEDFFLDLPPGCRLTFGYFNPAAPSIGQKSGYGHMGPGAETMRTTCLRIYSGKGDKDQLAAFMGISGFRDESIKLTKLVERVVVERRLNDDGEGTVEYGGKQIRELTVANEPEVPF